MTLTLELVFLLTCFSLPQPFQQCLKQPLYLSVLPDEFKSRVHRRAPAANVSVLVAMVQILLFHSPILFLLHRRQSCRRPMPVPVPVPMPEPMPVSVPVLASANADASNATPTLTRRGSSLQSSRRAGPMHPTPILIPLSTQCNQGVARLIPSRLMVF